MNKRLTNLVSLLSAAGCVLAACIGFTAIVTIAYDLGWHACATTMPTRSAVISSLSHDERRSITIQFEKDYGSWRSTLHNPCNFAPMDADKETKK